MARGAATLYAPGAALVFLSLLLPHPGADVPLVAAMGGIAAGVAAMLVRIGRRLPVWSFQALVTLGLGLITTVVFAAGPLGFAFACFYLWSGTYAWYFLSGREATVQTGLAIAALLAILASGRASAVYVLMVTGTLLTVCLWLRHAVRGV